MGKLIKQKPNKQYKAMKTFNNWMNKENKLFGRLLDANETCTNREVVYTHVGFVVMLVVAILCN